MCSERSGRRCGLAARTLRAKLNTVNLSLAHDVFLGVGADGGGPIGSVRRRYVERKAFVVPDFVGTRTSGK